MLGPFGSGVLIVLIPQVREDLGTTTAAVTAGITVYMVPFAVLQLVSGTLGERWGLARTVRAAYLLYAVVSVLTVVPGRAKPLNGGVHLVLLAAFLFVSVKP